MMQEPSSGVQVRPASLLPAWRRSPRGPCRRKSGGARGSSGRWVARGNRCLVILALLLPSCAGGANHADPGAPAEKSVLTAELLAIFPGFFVHGLGHRYAGASETADDILAMELYSLLTAGLGGGLLALGKAEDAEAVEVAGWVGIGVGGVGFLGTWLYDIVFTPSEVGNYNRRLRADP